MTLEKERRHYSTLDWLHLIEHIGLGAKLSTLKKKHDFMGFEYTTIRQTYFNMSENKQMLFLRAIALIMNLSCKYKLSCRWPISNDDGDQFGCVCVPNFSFHSSLILILRIC